MSRLDYALLLEEMCGRKYLTDCILSNPTTYKSLSVRKGTLLKATTLEECTNLIKKSGFPFNYKVMDDLNIRLQCSTIQVHQLTLCQMRLLQAVEHLEERVEVLHKLEWAEGLRSGVGVHVTIPSHPHPIKGIIIQQCGMSPDKIGIKFQVRLIGSDGNEDFEIFKNQIVTVSIDKITQSSSVAAATVKKCSDAQSDLSLKCGFKSGDRVMVQCKNNEIMEGTVKYVGFNEKNTEPGPVIGIQLEEKVDPLFVNGSIKGLDNLLIETSCDTTKVFLPVSKVQKINQPPTHPYITRLAARKQKQHSVQDPKDATNFLVQHQDPSIDIWRKNEIVRSGPNVKASQKPVKSGKSTVLSDHSKPVPGHAMRVIHNYEPIPGPAENKPNREVLSKPVELHVSNLQLPVIKDENPYKLEKESLIEFSNPPLYGVIKWVGYLSESADIKIAGLEMEEAISGGHDGKWKDTQYFETQKGRGMFFPLSKLKPDRRFGSTFKIEEQQNQKVEVLVISDHYVPAKLDIGKHIGKVKGIQGQHNSCYIDATLFGMFAFSDVFDDLFLDRCTAYTEVEKIKDEVQNIIQQKIVYPLREKGFVVFTAIMELRTVLDSLQALKGMTSDEKDPEEFLNFLLKKVFVTTPFLEIRRSFGSDKEFFVQLFIDPPKDPIVIPSTQSLLHHMFLEQNITFTKYPLKLFLQIPRHGKKFKSFNRVVPTINLDVSILCEKSQPCFICNKPGNVICTDCGSTDVLTPHIKFICFCQNCSSLWHSNPTRVHHKPSSRNITDDYETGRLELLSVICIETSHYVCFTRVTGSGKDRWIFFDSMAQRTDDERNLPEVTDCTEPLNSHVYGHKSIVNIESKKLPDLVRRFVEDAYLCIYVDAEGTMYQ